LTTKYMVCNDKLYDIIKSTGPGLFPGIYRLHVLDENGEFLPLPRLLDVDCQGIMYIGTSVAVPNRIGSLKKSIMTAYWQVDPKNYGHLPFRDASPHQTGKKIIRIPRLVERFPFERLCVTVERYTGAPEAMDPDVLDYGHTELEAKLLREYEMHYGEKPALNA